MSTKLINYKGADKQSPFRIAVGEALAEEPLRIACPYINTGYLEEIVRGKTDWQLLTDANEWLRLTGRDKRQAALDFIEKHLANIRDCSGLHAKVFIGGNGAFFGSANLTHSGLYRRDELGLQTDKTELHQELSDWFKQLWETKSSPILEELTKFVQKSKDEPNGKKKSARSPLKGREFSHISFNEIEPDEQSQQKQIHLAPKIGKFQSFEELVDNFIEQYPNGFQDGEYDKGYNGERYPKLKLIKRFKKTMNEGELRQLIVDEDYKEVAKRAIVLLNGLDYSLPSWHDLTTLKAGLKNKAYRKHFADSLFYHLYSSDTPEERFNSFARCLKDVEADKWSVQTFFLFLASPKEQLLLKPAPTKAAIKACGYKEFYKHGDKVDWKIYSDFLDFGKYLWSKLEEYGEQLTPRDMIDIHSFIYKAVKIIKDTK